MLPDPHHGRRVTGEPPSARCSTLASSRCALPADATNFMRSLGVIPADTSNPTPTGSIMFSINLTRALVTLALIAGLLAVARPATAIDHVSNRSGAIVLADHNFRATAAACVVAGSDLEPQPCSGIKWELSEFDAVSAIRA